MSNAEYAAEVSDLLRIVSTQQYVQITVCSLLVYDTLTTIDKEIKYFWTKKWYRLMHLLFFLNRYVGISGALTLLLYQALDVTTKLCQFSQWMQSISDALVGSAIDYILVLRVLALWENNKPLSIILYSIVLLEAAAKFTLTGLMVIERTSQATSLTRGIVVCLSSDDQIERVLYYQFIDWVMTASIGLIILSLAIFKAIDHWRISGLKRSSLVYIMIKDQIIYYLMVVFCSAINIASSRINVFGSYSLEKEAVMNLLGNPGFLCLLGSRMFLNLKEAGDVEVNGGTSIPSINVPASSISDPRFVEPAGPSSGSRV